MLICIYTTEDKVKQVALHLKQAGRQCYVCAGPQFPGKFIPLAKNSTREPHFYEAESSSAK